MVIPVPVNNCVMKYMTACTNAIASKVTNSIKTVTAVKVRSPLFFSLFVVIVVASFFWCTCARLAQVEIRLIVCQKSQLKNL